MYAGSQAQASTQRMRDSGSVRRKENQEAASVEECSGCMLLSGTHIISLLILKFLPEVAYIIIYLVPRNDPDSADWRREGNSDGGKQETHRRSIGVASIEGPQKHTACFKGTQMRTPCTTQNSMKVPEAARRIDKTVMRYGALKSTLGKGVGYSSARVNASRATSSRVLSGLRPFDEVEFAMVVVGINNLGIPVFRDLGPRELFDGKWPDFRWKNIRGGVSEFDVSLQSHDVDTARSLLDSPAELAELRGPDDTKRRWVRGGSVVMVEGRIDKGKGRSCCSPVYASAGARNDRSFDEVKDEELLLATVHCDGDARLARVEDETDEREDWNDGSSTLLRFRDCASDIRAVTPPRAAGGGDEEDAGSGYNLLPSKLAPAVTRTTPPLPPPPPSSIPTPTLLFAACVGRDVTPNAGDGERCWITTGGMHRLSLSIVSIILTHNPTPTRTAALPVVRRIGVVLVCDVARSRTIRHSSEDVADERQWHVLRDAVMDRETIWSKSALFLLPSSAPPATTLNRSLAPSLFIVAPPPVPPLVHRTDKLADEGGTSLTGLEGATGGGPAPSSSSASVHGRRTRRQDGRLLLLLLPVPPPILLGISTTTTTELSPGRESIPILLLLHLRSSIVPPVDAAMSINGFGFGPSTRDEGREGVESVLFPEGEAPSIGVAGRGVVGVDEARGGEEEQERRSRVV
ncbi:hypothetical protein R3P38DRAFT_3485485 [Favolaschia claudopus]|uniref:Uncharacterized protein n=1 Tax=Favolaschia claudopus TaxID=2862362 RepID=A0AAV9Z7C4_9AGAR